jgi:hypothetical protein
VSSLCGQQSHRLSHNDPIRVNLQVVRRVEPSIRIVSTEPEADQNEERAECFDPEPGSTPHHRKHKETDSDTEDYILCLSVLH